MLFDLLSMEAVRLVSPHNTADRRIDRESGQGGLVVAQDLQHKTYRGVDSWSFVGSVFFVNCVHFHQMVFFFNLISLFVRSQDSRVLARSRRALRYQVLFCKASRRSFDDTPPCMIWDLISLSLSWKLQNFASFRTRRTGRT